MKKIFRVIYKPIKMHFITMRWLYKAKSRPTDKDHPDANFEHLDTYIGSKLFSILKTYPNCIVFSERNNRRDPIVVEIPDEEGRAVFYFANFICYDAVLFKNKI